MSENSIRKEIVEIGRRIYKLGYASATDGNISYRSGNRIFVTPSGVGKGDLTIAGIVVVNLEGKILSGKMTPTSELRMHLAALRLRPDVNAVIHAHPPYATALSLAGINFDDYLLPEVVLTLKRIPTVRYARPASEDNALAISEFIKEYDALVLKQHGVLTVGKNLLDAFHNLERIEFSAKIIAIARMVGEIEPLPKQEA